MLLRFSKTARLTRSAEYQRLKREGVSIHGKFMVLSVIKHSTSRETRAGIITSRRVGGAVVRNRVRRRMRELLRADRPRFERGLWLVLIARQRAANASFDELRTEWRHLAERGAVLRSEP
ncbi:MAG: ribonuclease P protein component [Verrucomicrobiota bacterium]|nr:ribonuclease P protein component [Verrucomicrobiota bacterium]